MHLAAHVQRKTTWESTEHRGGNEDKDVKNDASEWKEESQSVSFSIQWCSKDCLAKDAVQIITEEGDVARSEHLTVRQYDLSGCGAPIKCPNVWKVKGGQSFVHWCVLQSRENCAVACYSSLKKFCNI